LRRLNIYPADVRTEVGRFDFPSAYDAELPNAVGLDGAVASGIAMCGQLMATMEYLRSITGNQDKIRSVEAQLEDVTLAKEQESKELNFELEQSRGQVKALETELE